MKTLKFKLEDSHLKIVSRLFHLKNSQNLWEALGSNLYSYLESSFIYYEHLGTAFNKSLYNTLGAYEISLDGSLEDNLIDEF